MWCKSDDKKGKKLKVTMNIRATKKYLRQASIAIRITFVVTLICFLFVYHYINAFNLSKWIVGVSSRDYFFHVQCSILMSSSSQGRCNNGTHYSLFNGFNAQFSTKCPLKWSNKYRSIITLPSIVTLSKEQKNSYHSVQNHAASVVWCKGKAINCQLGWTAFSITPSKPFYQFLLCS